MVFFSWKVFIALEKCFHIRLVVLTSWQAFSTCLRSVLTQKQGVPSLKPTKKPELEGDGSRCLACTERIGSFYWSVTGGSLWFCIWVLFVVYTRSRFCSSLNWGVEICWLFLCHACKSLNRAVLGVLLGWLCYHCLDFWQPKELVF